MCLLTENNNSSNAKTPVELGARDLQQTLFTRVSKMAKPQQNSWKKLKTIMNGLINPAWDSAFRYGFEVLGPTLFGFCRWLYERSKEIGIEHLFFLSRDGYLLLNAYKELYPASEIPISYLYISRKVAREAQVWLNPNASEISALFPENTYLECGEFCQYFSIDEGEADAAWKACDLTKHTRFLPRDILRDERLASFYRRIKPLMIEKSRQAYGKMIQYLHQNQFGGKVGLVDIGWKGTIQNCLQVIIQSDPEVKCEMVGLYLGLSGGASKSGNKMSFIAPDEEPQEFDAGFVEYPFLAPEGSLVGYDVALDGSIKPILAEYEYDREDHDVIRNMQEGALQFIKSTKEFSSEDFPWDAPFSYANLKRVSKHPTLYEAKLFGNLTHYDGGKRRIAAPRSIAHYLLHPKDFPYDLSVSGWRIGFLRRLLKIELDYNQLLKIYKNKKLICKDKEGQSQC